MSVPGWVTLVLAAAVAAALAPICTGLIQTTKATLQGRRGGSPLQPYRDLRRLWGKSTVEPETATISYRLAPAICAAAAGGSLVVAATVLVPGGWPVAAPMGTDFLVIIGLLTLGRFVLTLSAWDTTNGFSLLGAARDLAIAVSAEAVLLLTFALAAIQAGSTSIRVMNAASAGWDVWLTPAHWCALLAMCVAVITEMGRQPIDNPDTHLELTMIHEGPLLEYAGRDLGYLQWAASARHVILIALLAGIFLPHGGTPLVAIAITLAWFVLALVGVAFAETLLAKMRLLRVPVFLGTAAVVAIIGLVTSLLVSP